MAKITKNIDINGNPTKIVATKVLDSKGRLIGTAKDNSIGSICRVIDDNARFKDWQNEIVLIGKSLNESILKYESRKLDCQNKITWFLWDRCERLALALRNDLRKIYKEANASNYTTFDVFRSLPNNLEQSAI